jgi:hypothetical protein
MLVVIELRLVLEGPTEDGPILILYYLSLPRTYSSVVGPLRLSTKRAYSERLTEFHVRLR